MEYIKIEEQALAYLHYGYVTQKIVRQNCKETHSNKLSKADQKGELTDIKKRPTKNNESILT